MKLRLRAPVLVGLLVTAAVCSDESPNQDGSSSTGESTASGATTVTSIVEEGSETEQGGHRSCDGSSPPEVTITRVLQEMNSPIAAQFPDNQPEFVYVAERGGAIWRIDLEDWDTRVQILDLEVKEDGEMGLLSFAMHPDFDGETERRMYVSHTPSVEGNFSALTEFVVDGDSATMQQELLRETQPATNHNGGHVAFGPDGHLYFALGDGGGGRDEFERGQDPSEPLASILRFDIADPAVAPPGNLTSSDVAGGAVDPRVLHWGLRNPWRFSFDRQSGDLWIGDVGQDDWEEIDFLPRGTGPTNFGWPVFEGNGPCPGCAETELTPGSSDIKPVYVYENPNQGPNDEQRSVTGGYVYRGTAIPELVGRYVFADYASGEVETVTWDGDAGACDVGTLLPRNLFGTGIVSFAEDRGGELYIIHGPDGYIARIDPS